MSYYHFPYPGAPRLTCGPFVGMTKAMNPKTRTRAPISVYKIVNELRRERGLPKVALGSNPTKITRPLIRQIAAEVWAKYPQSLTDPGYQLGDLTLALVDQEIRQRLHDLRRGVVVGQAALKDYFN